MKLESIANLDISGGLQDLLGYATRIQSIGDFVFFRLILNYLEDRINKFGIEMLNNMMTWVGGIALVLMTLWVLIQGYRIITGQSRDSMMALVTNMARAALIVSVATSMAIFGTSIQDFLTKDVKGVISTVVTGKNDPPEKQIDQALGWMQVALSSVDAIKVVDDPSISNDKTQAQLFIGLGTGGPAVVAGSMLLLYQIAMALFVGFGPLFILCLLFDQTKQLFQKWLFYGIGTMFSMAVLAAMVSIALDMVIRVSVAFWARAAFEQFLLDGGSSDGITSQAMQQGGMGLILTTLILTAPPMAAFFFQGTLGNFMAFSQIGGAGAGQPGPQGQPPGSYTPPQSTNANTSNDAGSIANNQHVMPRNFGTSSGIAQQDTGRKGAALT
ncbi:type IV secretion system protein [Stenotrophomonas sp.]|uniref:type IV secretion system protein n=1 Tax=Stenotrophomonas sp. TaxID=69392 RepID=UPI0028AF0A1D|nr:type IV secretion system protein [Stenotrophomonas sp.]